MNDDMDEKESIDTPLEIFLDGYTYIGEDGEGYHHHADRNTSRIIVCDDQGERVGERGWHVQLDGEVDHVEYGLKYAADLEEWADYVDTKRGWTDRALKTHPGLLGEMDNAFQTGGQA